MNQLLYGTAYYDEYMPSSRVEQDIELWKQAGINVVRIADSTWATMEPSEGVFDFSHVTRVLDATKEADIQVIICTPTYAIPPWMALKYPETVVTTKDGKDRYGKRQNMDITHPTYLYFAHRILHKLLQCVSGYDHVIGFQLDNETKAYDTSSDNVHRSFVAYLKEKFGTIEALNDEFGFNYWSNRVDSFENIPSAVGTINGSFGAEFEKFQRTLVDEQLRWQTEIVKQYRRDDQFITQNFDYEWRGYSFGMQPDVDHRQAGIPLDIAGCDIYHPTQNLLTGKEIAMGGNLCRAIKNDNYLVVETEAQGQVQWLPYDGQIRLQAFSHVGSGANSVMYWHWHSIHNSFETYWKGILSHDFSPSRVYQEVCTVGQDFKRIGSHLVNLEKKNKVAMLVSNLAFTAMKWFPTPDGQLNYNDFFRWMHDALFELNVEIDILFPQDRDRFGAYEMIVVPPLYSADDDLLQALSDFCKNGGNLVASFKTGMTNEYVTVAHDAQPHLLTDCFGMSYDQYTLPVNTGLCADGFDLSDEDRQIDVWMELLQPSTARVIAYYDHNHFGRQAAVTANDFGKGHAYYIGCYTTNAYLKALLQDILQTAGLWQAENEVQPPLCIKKGVNDYGKTVVFIFNYSDVAQPLTHLYGSGVELLSGQAITAGDTLTFEPWGFKIIELD